MSQLVSVRNTLADNAQYTFLSSSSSSGGTALTVKNINAFQPSWAVQLGKTGEEFAEVLVLGTATPSGSTLNTTGTIRFNHPTDTPVYAIKYNQIVFKVSTLGTAGTVSAITDGTITITPDSLYTEFDHTAGSASYAYKASFRNSIDGGQTSDSGWLTSTGFSFYSLAKMRDRIKRKLFSASFIGNDDTIDDWINEWMEKMTNTAINVNQDYLIGTMDVSYGTAGLGTITATDFKDIRRIWLTSNGTDYYAAKKKHVTDYLPDETFNETHPYYYLQGDNVFGVLPSGSLGTARIWYYKRPSLLANDTDEIPVSMQSYTKSFVDYSLAQAYYLDSRDTSGDRFMSFAENELNKFKSEITPRSATGPTYISLVESIDADDNFEMF